MQASTLEDSDLEEEMPTWHSAIRTAPRPSGTPASFGGASAAMHVVEEAEILEEVQASTPNSSKTSGDSSSSSADETVTAPPRRKPRPAIVAAVKPGVKSKRSGDDDDDDDDDDDWFAVRVKLPLGKQPSKSGTSGRSKVDDKAVLFQKKLLEKAAAVAAAAKTDAKTDAKTSAAKNSLLHLLAQDEDPGEKEAEGSSPPKKRGRGRPRKYQKTDTTAREKEPSSEDDDLEFSDRDKDNNNNTESDSNPSKRERSASFTPPPEAPPVQLPSKWAPPQTSSRVVEPQDDDDEDDDEIPEMDPELAAMLESAASPSTMAVSKPPLDGAGSENVDLTGGAGDISTIYVRVRAFPHPQNSALLQQNRQKSFKMRLRLTDTFERVMRNFRKFVGYDGEVYLLYNGVKLLAYATPQAFYLPVGEDSMHLDAVTAAFYPVYEQLQAEEKERLLSARTEPNVAAEELPSSENGANFTEAQHNEDVSGGGGWLQLYIKTRQNQVYEFQVQPTTTIGGLKRAYREKAGIVGDGDAASVELEFDGERLEDKQTISDLDLEDGDQLHALL